VARSNLTQPKTARSNVYKKARDEDLLKQIKELLETRPSYGYRRVAAYINRALKEDRCALVNHKRIYRLMKINRLLLRKPEHRPKRLHEGKPETLRSNTRWCSDSFSIQCSNGDRVHLAFSLDTCDREVMRYIASTIGIDSQAIRDLMLETIEYRLGRSATLSPIQWLSDNGSCYTAREMIAFGRSLVLEICTTLPYSPQSNGMAEAFVKTIKRDYVYYGDLKDAKSVMSQLPIWIEVKSPS
jgi:putative transposase